MTAHEPEALIDDVEDAARVVVARALRLALQDLVDEDVLALRTGGIEFEVARDLAEFRHAHFAKVGDLEIVTLARSLDLLLLLEFGYRSSAAATDRGAATWSTVA